MPLEQLKTFMGRNPRPDDFDSFWDRQVAKLRALPIKPDLKQGDAGNAKVAYWGVTLDTVENSKIRGHLARPAAAGKYPAIIYCESGIQAIARNLVTNQAAKGWLTLAVAAHDLPLEENEAFYRNAVETTLKKYSTKGNESRDTTYLLRLFLVGCRAADYITTHPDWDGKTLVVIGRREASAEAMMAAVYNPKVSALMLLTPWCCDFTAPKADRAIGWPAWAKGEGAAITQRMEAGRYYDLVNLASRVKCPTLVGLGLVDEAAPASGVYAMSNQLAAPKEVVPSFRTSNARVKYAEYMERLDAWMTELKSGKPAPVK
jgi:cephalosporin-C deacetylase-like acetyl esterase